MIRQLTDDGGSILPLISLVLFSGIFFTVLFYVFFDRRRSHLDHMAALPLDDEDQADEEDDRA